VTATDRHLAWAACLNIRDFGGLRTHDGRLTKLGVLVRASMIGSLNPEGEEAMRAHGVRTVVDLRWPAEVEAQPSIFAKGIPYRNTPVDSDRQLALLDHASSGTMARQLATLAQPSSGIRDALEAIAWSEPAVVIHCQAGRDRTGIVTALILAAAGVVDEDIDMDYCASDEALADEYARLSREQPGETVGMPGAVERRKRVMGLVLRTMREAYGDARSYLAALGVTPGAANRLRQMLVG
jgi:protein-tyrosine phosphatase